MDASDTTMDPLVHDGTVIDVTEGVARVKCERTTRCGSCCGCSTAQDGGMIAEVEAIPDLKPGDRVRVALDPQGVWRGTFWTFVLPLAGLVVGAAVGARLGFLRNGLGLSRDAAAALSGLVLMALVFALGMLRNRRQEQQPAFRPHIVRKL